jgi:hypothetical protein
MAVTALFEQSLKKNPPIPSWKPECGRLYSFDQHFGELKTRLIFQPGGVYWSAWQHPFTTTQADSPLRVADTSSFRGMCFPHKGDGKPGNLLLFDNPRAIFLRQIVTPERN